jgi:hypothetical protein
VAATAGGASGRRRQLPAVQDASGGPRRRQRTVAPGDVGEWRSETRDAAAVIALGVSGGGHVCPRQERLRRPRPPEA